MAGNGQKVGVWTEVAEDKFFEVLAASCNVTLACKEARVSSAGVYRRRRKEAGFRSRWGEALATGYACRPARAVGAGSRLNCLRLSRRTLRKHWPRR